MRGLEKTDEVIDIQLFFDQFPPALLPAEHAPAIGAIASESHIAIDYSQPPDSGTIDTQPSIRRDVLDRAAERRKHRIENGIPASTVSADTPITINWYKHEIGKHPLLDDEEVVALTKQVQAGVRIKDAHSEEENPRFTKAEQKTLAEADAAKWEIVERNLRLVVSTANRLHVPDRMFMDAIQAGNLGLEKSIEKYDPKKGTFGNYATWRIHNFISRELYKHGETVYMPPKRGDEIDQALKRADGDDNKLSAEDRREYLAWHAISGDMELSSTSFDDGSDSTIFDRIPADSPEPADIVTGQRGILDGLRQRDDIRQEVVETVALYLGIEDNDPKTLSEIGVITGVSASCAKERMRRGRELLRVENDPTLDAPVLTRQQP